MFHFNERILIELHSQQMAVLVIYSFYVNLCMCMRINACVFANIWIKLLIIQTLTICQEVGFLTFDTIEVYLPIISLLSTCSA